MLKFLRIRLFLLKLVKRKGVRKYTQKFKKTQRFEVFRYQLKTVSVVTLRMSFNLYSFLSSNFFCTFSFISRCFYALLISIVFFFFSHFQIYFSNSSGIFLCFCRIIFCFSVFLKPRFISFFKHFLVLCNLLLFITVLPLSVNVFQLLLHFFIYFSPNVVC